jgi:hypothetical protein
MALTKKQRELMDYLEGYIEEHRVSPTYEEIAARFGYRSLSTVHEHVRNLVGRGLVKVERGRPRSIEVVGRDDRERPYRPVFPPAEWLRERCESYPVSPLPPEVETPLEAMRRYRESWRWIRDRLVPGDELWSFRAPEESWRQGCGRAGYAVVRGGAVVDGVLAWDEMSEPRACGPGGRGEREE